MSTVGFPLLLIPFAIYNIIAFLMPSVSFSEPLVRLTLVSGAEWPISLSDVLLTLGILLLLLEVMRGARPGGKFLTDHLLALLVFGGSAAQFVMWPKFGTSTYFLLVLMAMVDFLAGIALRGGRASRVQPASRGAVARGDAKGVDIKGSDAKTDDAKTDDAKGGDAKGGNIKGGDAKEAAAEQSGTAPAELPREPASTPAPASPAAAPTPASELPSATSVAESDRQSRAEGGAARRRERTGASHRKRVCASRKSRAKERACFHSRRRERSIAAGRLTSARSIP